MKIILRHFLLTLLCLIIISSPEIYAKTDKYKLVMDQYLKLQKDFSDESCKTGTEARYRELDKNYRGNGNFIPISIDEKIDFKTIRNLIPLIKDKDIWINKQIEFLNTNNDLKELKLAITRLKNKMELLLEAKREYFFAKDIKVKEKIRLDAKKQFTQLLTELMLFKNKIPFLLSFKFPVNHLSLRSEYEKYKTLNTKEARLRSNSIYLFRKIVQDGSYDKELSKNDAIIRSVFDTLFISLNKESNRDFLTDIERVDFRFVMTNFEKIISFKSNKLIERFSEWKARNERTLNFYQDLIEGHKIKLTEDSQIKDVTSLLEDRAKSLYTLKEFVLSNEANTYKFWSTKSELFQSLFAIETILYSEVGLLDAPDALERRDVAQIVINRSENSFYNTLGRQDALNKYLIPKEIKSRNKWLDVLFKEGEFSFTYFYIPGNFHIYCPDMSRTGQYLRRVNIRIALELLNRPKADFNALRYFSRTGMYGRIEMDTLWNDFTALPEVPGKPVRNPRKLYNLFNHDRYKYLYDFTNDNLKQSFLVVEIKGKIYVIDKENPKKIFYYRNPHQFKYFTLIK